MLHTWPRGGGLGSDSAISNFEFGQSFDSAASSTIFLHSFLVVPKLRPIWGKQDNEKGNVVIMANR